MSDDKQMTQADTSSTSKTTQAVTSTGQDANPEILKQEVEIKGKKVTVGALMDSFATQEELELRKKEFNKFSTEQSQKFAMGRKRLELTERETELLKKDNVDTSTDEGADDDGGGDTTQSVKPAKDVELQKVRTERDMLFHRELNAFYKKHPDALDKDETAFRQLWNDNPALDLEDINAMLFGKEAIGRQQTGVMGSDGGGSIPATKSTATKPKNIFEMTSDEAEASVAEEAKKIGVFLR